MSFNFNNDYAIIALFLWNGLRGTFDNYNNACFHGITIGHRRYPWKQLAPVVPPMVAPLVLTELSQLILLIVPLAEWYYWLPHSA